MPPLNTPLWGLPDPLDQPEFYADVPIKRGVAWVIDVILISLMVGILVLVTAGIGLFFIGFLYILVGFSYRVLSLAGGSATLGMRLVAIELRRHDGTRFDMGTAILHTLGYMLSTSFVLPQLASIALMLTTPRGQGLTDMVLGTAAINRSARF